MKFYYVYRLTCTVEHDTSEKYYYGSRVCCCEPHQDIRYWSSSKRVKAIRNRYGPLAFCKKIVGIYPTRMHALEKEMALHARLNVKDHPLFLNQANQTSVYFSFMRTQACSEEHKQKIREKLLHQVIPEERKSRISETLSLYWSTAKTSRKPSHRTKQKIAEKLRDKPLSESHKTAIGKGIREYYLIPGNKKKAKIRNQSTLALQVRCPWCEKSGSKPAMTRWHFSNCQKNPSSPQKKRPPLMRTNTTHWKTKLLVCPHCTKQGHGPVMLRWHFTHCVQNTKLEKHNCKAT